ncbi:MAG: Thiol-disulfide isomerase / thioredoxin, partial [Armatimonadetes bacterium]|nr:Thiol-disulfide isomerase / thioredoxin [Armatimonadota bacterium]
MMITSAPVLQSLLARAVTAALVVLLGGSLAAGSAASAQVPARPVPPAVGTLAPEFPPNAAWLNTDRPLTLRALRGKAVLLDFWTYGCINCMQILPDLKRLERKYPNELVIISVHTAKFKNEDETQNIRSAVLRYSIEHPILNDSGQRYWNALGVQIWPTQVLIDPAGRLVGAVAGEGNYDVVDRTVARVLQEARTAGHLNSEPIRFALEAARAPSGPLSFPGKVLADTGAGGTGRIYIADSHHNRIVITNPAGEVEAVAGTGEIGRKDGGFHEATFANPQGMTLRKLPGGGHTLLVADTNNHTIRELDLKRGTVTTIAGTGKQADVTRRVVGGSGTKASLASPWDVLAIDKTLYIAMAGPHQIWSMNLETGLLLPYAGSGKEARTDGPLRVSAFAQPSGLSTDGKQLFVADSEISAIRAVDLPGNGGRVRTLAGGDLFDFGDREGPGSISRFQHPLGVAYGGGFLYIADTYNHKLKRLDLSGDRVETFVGGGAEARPFYEPGGISLSGDRLYVADTNNHRICVVDVKTRAVTTLTLKNLPVPLPAEPERTPEKVDLASGAVVLPLALLAPDSAGELLLDVKLPPAHHLNTESPQRFTAEVVGAGLTVAPVSVDPKKFALPLRVPFTTGVAGTKGMLS